MAGWWKFQRDWLQHPIINKDADYLRVWIELHNMAAYDNSRQVEWKGKVITLEAGQLTAGRLQLADATGVNEFKVYRILNRFKSAHLIAQQTSSQTSLISILSWATEQQDAQQIAQQMHNTCTTDAQHLHTNKEVRNQEVRNYYYYPDDNNKTLQISDVLAERMEALRRGEL